MNTMNEYLPFIIMFFYYMAFAVLHSAYIKVSAGLIGGMRVVWRDAFRFALGVIAILLIFRSLALKVGMPISVAMLIALGLVLNLSLGGWYFGKFALTQQGEPAGWKGGILISALAYVFLVLTLFIAEVVNR
jgi:hypothetical protein